MSGKTNIFSPRHRSISSIEKMLAISSILAALALLLLGLCTDVEAFEKPQSENDQGLRALLISSTGKDGHPQVEAANENTRVVPHNARSIPLDGLLSRVKKTSNGARAVSSVGIAAHDFGGPIQFVTSKQKSIKKNEKPEFGYLKVILEPLSARENNARWKIHGSEKWLRSYGKIKLPVGVARIKFNRIKGFKRPSTHTAEIQAGKLTVVEIEYHEK